MADVGKHRGGGVSKHGEKYRARLRTGGTTVSLGVYDTEEEAQAAVDAALSAVDGGVRISGAQSLGDWCATWLTRREEGGRVAGIEQEWSVYRTHVEPHPIASLPLRALTRPALSRWLDYLTHDARQVQTIRKHDEEGRWTVEHRLTTKRLGRQTIQHCTRVVRGALSAAVSAGLLEDSPGSALRAPRRSADEAEGDGASWTWLRPEEIDALMAAGKRPGSKINRMVPERARLAWTIAIYTGLRLGELRRLEWGDVDFRRSELVVRKPKSRKTRTVPLLPPARQALERWRELAPGLPAARVWRGVRGNPPAPRVPKSWDLWWRAWGPDIVGRHVRVHDLRHTCASHLVQGTWGRALSLYDVRDWLGHSSIKVTERYAHLAPEGLRGLAAEMAASWSGHASGHADTDSGKL